MMLNKLLKTFLVLTSISGLIGCGSGSSNSGAANGVYSGGAKVVYTFPDNSKAEANVRTIITVSGSKVTVTDGKQVGEGALENNRYSVPLVFESTSSKGTVCKFSLAYDGVIDGALTRGSISGRANCVRTSGFRYTIVISGTYVITKQVKNKQAIDSGFEAPEF